VSLTGAATAVAAVVLFAQRSRTPFVIEGESH
jgi:hypothetical protein